jgi:hypothetical protein
MINVYNDLSLIEDIIIDIKEHAMLFDITLQESYDILIDDYQTTSFIRGMINQNLYKRNYSYYDKIRI